MAKIVSNLVAATFWMPTNELRWKTKQINIGNGCAKMENVLEQKWIECGAFGHRTGKDEWRDIPTVEE